MTNFKTKIAAVVLVAVLTALTFTPAITAYGASETKYSDYIENSAYKESLEDIILCGGDYDASQSSALVSKGSYLGEDNVLIWDSNDDQVSYKFDVKTEGLYNIRITYASVAENGNDFHLMLGMSSATIDDFSHNLIALGIFHAFAP